MSALKRVQDYTDAELADLIRGIVARLSQKELRVYFPSVTPNDLSRVGRVTRKLSARKRRAWEEIVSVWEEEGRPDPLTLAEAIGSRRPDRVEILFQLLMAPAWKKTGLSLEQRFEVGQQIVRGKGYSPEERRIFRSLVRAILSGGADGGL